MNKITPTIAIIGAGNMGSSLLGGLINKNYTAGQLWATDSDAEKLHSLKQQFKIHTTTNNVEAVKTADVVIFAVKPHILQNVSEELASAIQKGNPLIISIVSGIRETNLQKWLGGGIPIVRTMPNTPALIGCGASALYANQYVSTPQRQLAESILCSVGIVVWLEEEQLIDAVTAVSGSGPAYFFLVIEALLSAAEKLGLTAETARLLVLQTAYGAARMALESNKQVVELRRNVTSPGGTTEQAIRVFEEKNIRGIFLEALQAAANRARELGDLNV